MARREEDKKKRQIGGAETNQALQVVQYIVGILMAIGSIYFAVTCKNGDTLHMIAAICCPCCYFWYGLICFFTKPAAKPGFGSF